MEIKRLPAKKVRIADIINGKYFSGSKEDMKPGYVITPFGEKISRANVIATVIEKFTTEDGSYSTIAIDDGSEAVSVRTFKENVSLLNEIKPGDLVLVIGKIKEYNGEIYINGEIVKQLVDSNFEILRKSEITASLIGKKKIVEEIRNIADSMSEEELKNYVKEKHSMDEESLQVVLESKKLEVDYKPKVMEIIEKLDDGNGVEISKIFETLDMPEQVVERTLDEMINLGFVFEPKIGYLKKV